MVTRCWESLLRATFSNGAPRKTNYRRRNNARNYVATPCVSLDCFLLELNGTRFEKLLNRLLFSRKQTERSGRGCGRPARPGGQRGVNAAAVVRSDNWPHLRNLPRQFLKSILYQARLDWVWRFGELRHLLLENNQPGPPGIGSELGQQTVCCSFS